MCACVCVHVSVHGKGNEGWLQHGFLQNICRCPKMSSASLLQSWINWISHRSRCHKTIAVYTFIYKHTHIDINAQMHFRVYCFHQTQLLASDWMQSTKVKWRKDSVKKSVKKKQCPQNFPTHINILERAHILPQLLWQAVKKQHIKGFGSAWSQLLRRFSYFWHFSPLSVSCREN